MGWRVVKSTYGYNNRIFNLIYSSIFIISSYFSKTRIKELLKTPNKQEYEREKLQAQQTLYLGQQWQKIENNLYSQAVYYEPTRLASYYDYESMEYTPEISAALDIYAEESTTTNEDGFILQIYSY